MSRTVRITTLKSLNGEQLWQDLNSRWTDYEADSDLIDSARLEVADWADVNLCTVTFDADADQFLIHGTPAAYITSDFIPAPYAMRAFGALPVAAVA